MFKAPVLKFCVVAPSTILTEAVELFLAILIVTGYLQVLHALKSILYFD